MIEVMKNEASQVMIIMSQEVADKLMGLLAFAVDKDMSDILIQAEEGEMIDMDHCINLWQQRVVDAEVVNGSVDFFMDLVSK